MLEVTKGKVGMITLVDSSVKAATTIVLRFQTCGVGQLIMVFLNVRYIGALLNSYLICKQKSSKSSKKKSNLNNKNRVMNPQSVPKLSQVIDPKPSE